MAKSNGNGTNGPKAQALADAEAQRAELAQRVDALAAEAQKLNLRTPGDIDKWAEAEGKAAAYRAAIAAIDAELPELRRQADAERSAAAELARNERLSALRKTERDRLGDVVRAAKQLQAALGALGLTERELTQLGTSPSLAAGLALRLGRDLARTFDGWKGLDPELLGLPPLPTRLEQAITEARRDVERAKKLVAEGRELRGQDSEAIRLIRENRQAALARHEQRLRELETQPA